MSGHPVRRRARGTAAAVVATLATLVLAGCSSDPNSMDNQAKQGDDKNFVVGDGSIQRLPAADRSDPVTLSGTTLTGKPWSLKDAAGRVVVVNVWGSWCPPCVAETPRLRQAYSRLQAQHAPVSFIGINEQEAPPTARAWLERNHVTYPSLRWDGGAALLGLQGKASATPSTLVLDSQGRIAARISGEVTSAATLVDLVHDVLSPNAAS